MFPDSAINREDASVGSASGAHHPNLIELRKNPYGKNAAPLHLFNVWYCGTVANNISGKSAAKPRKAQTLGKKSFPQKNALVTRTPRKQLFMLSFL